MLHHNYYKVNNFSHNIDYPYYDKLYKLWTLILVKCLLQSVSSFKSHITNNKLNSKMIFYIKDMGIFMYHII